MNYCVVGNGHISFFDQFEEAMSLWLEYDKGTLYNMWGLMRHE